MKHLFILCIAIIHCSLLFAQNNTDISLKWKDKAQYETRIKSETGDLYNRLSHHGPAIENDFLALRIYFNRKCAIDVYNKTQRGLELKEAAWYPTPKQQREGWGADQYKVGNTIGCGGVRLWDGDKVVYLDPVRCRTARVCKEANTSYMEMLSEGIPYMGDTIDILLRVTVFSGIRAAKVETFALCNQPVQFLTGLNYHSGTLTKEGVNYICSWGTHPEDLAINQLSIGAAIIYNPDDFYSIKKEEKEYQLVSKPTKYLETWISSSCEDENDLNTFESFVEYLEKF